MKTKLSSISFSLICILLFLFYLDYNRSSIRAFYDFEHKEIEKVLKQCGKGYYLSVIPVKGIFKKTYSYSKLYTVIDDNFINDVKEGNIAYQKEKEIDKCTYSFINSIPDQGVSLFDNINELPKCKTIQDTLNITHRKINHLAFTVIKNHRGVIIIYILTNTNKENKCNNDEVKKLLKGLSNKVKKRMLWTL
jgi:hypothetical protein